MKVDFSKSPIDVGNVNSDKVVTSDEFPCTTKGF